MMLQEMQRRKRATGLTLDKGLVKEISLSAFERVARRKKGEKLGSLEREAREESELKKIRGASDQTQRIPGSYKRYASIDSREGNKNNASVADSMLLSGELSLVDKNSPNVTRASKMITVIRGFNSRLPKNK